MTAASRDTAAIYYNPANLAQRTPTHFSVGLHVILPALFIDTTGLETDEPTEPLLPGNNVSLALGFVFPLGGLIDYRVAVGIAISLPLVQLTRVEAIDPATPHFYTYQSRPDHLVIAPALGFRLTDWLRLGVGVQILAALGADIALTGDVVRRRIEERSLTVDLAGTVGPTAGLTLTLGRFEAAISYRDDLELTYAIPIDLQFEDVGRLTVDLRGHTLYTPRQLNFGVAYTFEAPRLTVAADATVAFWSGAPDPAARINAVLTDEELRPEEETVATLFDIQSDPIALGAEDVIIPRLGLEWQIDETFTFRTGYFHRPASIPDQTSYANLLDATANVFSLGGGVTFPDPLQVNDKPLSIDLHLQWTHLSDRVTLKDEDAGATSSGWLMAGGNVYNLGVEFRQDF
jgi:hypothetical protein